MLHMDRLLARPSDLQCPANSGRPSCPCPCPCLPISALGQISTQTGSYCAPTLVYVHATLRGGTGALWW